MRDIESDMGVPDGGECGLASIGVILIMAAFGSCANMPYLKSQSIERSNKKDLISKQETVNPLLIQNKNYIMVR